MEVQCVQCARLFTAQPKAHRKFCSMACYHESDGMVKVRGCRVDGNHSEMIDGLRAVGAKVADLSRMGGGVPDLLVAFRGRIFLMEVKNPQSAYGRRGLSRKQRAFADQGWPVNVVTSVDEAVSLILL